MLPDPVFADHSIFLGGFAHVWPRERLAEDQIEPNSRASQAAADEPETAQDSIDGIPASWAVNLVRYLDDRFAAVDRPSER
jgi:hypothetical protein